MKTFVLPVSLMLSSLAVEAQGNFIITVGDNRRAQLRDAVDAHRASQRDEVRLQEARAGRRLTAAELAELREQVRGQRPQRTAVILESAESQPAERIAPASASGVRTVFGP